MFLRLHYKESGREFLVNVNAIDGIEINGQPDLGCVLTIASVQGGERSYEVVSETFEQISRWLNACNLLVN